MEDIKTVNVLRADIATEPFLKNIGINKEANNPIIPEESTKFDKAK